VESEPWGRARRRPSSEVEVESEPWVWARRRPSSEVEVGSEPWGRARRSFLWRLRLDSAAVSDPCIECSCDTVGWRGDLAKVASLRSLPELGLGRVEGALVA
jgi:hypothetical protein